MSCELATFEMAGNRCQVGQDPLASFLQGARKSPVRIQAHAVKRIDAMRLQILLSARNKWREEQMEFEVTNITKGFQESLLLFGLPEDEFGEDVVK